MCYFSQIEVSIGNVSWFLLWIYVDSFRIYFFYANGVWIFEEELLIKFASRIHTLSQNQNNKIVDKTGLRLTE